MRSALFALSLGLLPTFAWTLGAECLQVSLKTSTLPSKATAGRRATLKIKLKASPASFVSTDVVLKITLPPGVVLQTTRQKRVWSHTRATSLKQRGANLFFSDVLPAQGTPTEVLIKVLVEDCPPDALKFDIATYLASNGSCFTTYPAKVLPIKQGRNSCRRSAAPTTAPVITSAYIPYAQGQICEGAELQMNSYASPDACYTHCSLTYGPPSTTFFSFDAVTNSCSCFNRIACNLLLVQGLQTMLMSMPETTTFQVLTLATRSPSASPLASLSPSASPLTTRSPSAPPKGTPSPSASPLPTRSPSRSPLSPPGNLPGSVWTSQRSAADFTWTSVTYGAGLFVSISLDGFPNQVQTSPDGVTWVSRVSAADNLWNGVTFGDGLFVAVAASGEGNRVQTSRDGVTWTSRASAADNKWSAVTYGAGLFVAVATDGFPNQVQTSPDGVTWLSRASAASHQWYGVTYGAGLFVAVAGSGDGNRVQTSGDGINWFSRRSAADNTWTAVTYGVGLFVAVAIDGFPNQVQTSFDGTNWISRASAVDRQWYGVTFGNGTFVAVAGSGFPNQVQISRI